MFFIDSKSVLFFTLQKPLMWNFHIFVSFPFKVINVAYSKLKLQLHFKINFLLLSQLTFRKINKRVGVGGGMLIWYSRV